MARSKVDLPDPDSPMSATISFPDTSSEHDLTIETPSFSTSKFSHDTLKSSKGSELALSSPRDCFSKNRMYCKNWSPNAMRSEMIRRINPICKATSRRPTLVSRTTLVVKTRVFPAMLPPTIKTAPTSAIARPKPRRTAFVIPLRAQ